MKIRSRAAVDGPANTWWGSGALAPSLAVTADWWNQAVRLDPISEERFRTHLDGAETTPALAETPAPRPGQHRCPACGSIIYSRRHQLCGVCAHPLPAESMFSEAESVRIELVVEVDRQRHRQWLARVSS